MRTTYNLECVILDKMGRTKKVSHVGIFSSMESVEEAKTKLISEHGDRNVSFNIHIIENWF